MLGLIPHRNSLLAIQQTLAAALLLTLAGCSALPDVRHAVEVHNPFPQLKRVAILPFYNQSNEPTVDSGAVSEAYYAALQSVPGFEVLPVGVTRLQLEAYSATYGPPQTGEDFQTFARMLGVDAVVQGAVTDFSPYYPPRMGLTVHWYAANPGFHPIPVGYGLPWGTKAEKDIPSGVVLETEFELARQQLATQTPDVPVPPMPARPAVQQTAAVDDADLAAPALDDAQAAAPDRSVVELLPPPVTDATPPAGPSEWQPMRSAPQIPPTGDAIVESASPPHDAMPHDAIRSDAIHGASIYAHSEFSPADSMLPVDWPDPSGLIPNGPQPYRPIAQPQHEPVLSHTRLYDGADSKFTERLANHISVSDDRRPTNWQAYLSRTDDFVRFCCRLHVTEMLEARGGADQSDLILRWPIGRYRSQ